MKFVVVPRLAGPGWKKNRTFSTSDCILNVPCVLPGDLLRNLPIFWRAFGTLVAPTSRLQLV